MTLRKDPTAGLYAPREDQQLVFWAWLQKVPKPLERNCVRKQRLHLCCRQIKRGCRYQIHDLSPTVGKKGPPCSLLKERFRGQDGGNLSVLGRSRKQIEVTP